jgi:hypothetical protein
MFRLCRLFLIYMKTARTGTSVLRVLSFEIVDLLVLKRCSAVS